MVWYVVYRGREPGVYATWATCHAQASGFKNCCYKSFPTKEEAIASYKERKGFEYDTMDIWVFEKPPSSGVTKTPCLLVVTLVQSFLLLMLIISSTLLSIATSACDGFKLPWTHVLTMTLWGTMTYLLSFSCMIWLCRATNHTLLDGFTVVSFNYVIRCSKVIVNDKAWWTEAKTSLFSCFLVCSLENGGNLPKTIPGCSHLMPCGQPNKESTSSYHITIHMGNETWSPSSSMPQ